MQGDVNGLVAFDFVLRLVLGGVMRVALVIRVLRMDLDNPAADMPGLGIPGDVIADFETLSHVVPPTRIDAGKFFGRSNV
jgi:hypothetical protein